MTATIEFLQEQKRLAEAATDGPWASTYGAHEPSRVWASDDDAEPLAVLGGYVEQSDSQADAEFIAAARTSAPKLIAAVEAVMAVHRPVDVEPSETVCHGCSTLRGTGENARYFPYEEWPCPTIRAIEAELIGGECDE